MQPHQIETRDGYSLAARSFGDSHQARAGVLIAPAMGVEQAYYEDFARWLAQQGYYVLSFDYRGMGHSRHGALRSVKANIRTWGEEDAGAALAWLREHLPGRPMAWIGHSLGGQIVGMVPGALDLSAVMTVAAASGYVGDNAPQLRRRVGWLWHVIVPLATPLFGYFPGRRLGMVGDLPAGVIWQWRRWCLSPDYLFEVEPAELSVRYAECRWPLLALSFLDDELLTSAGTAKLHSHYRRARLDLRELGPQDAGGQSIGHFGFFRKRFTDTLWPLAAQWLERQLNQGHA